MDARDLQRRVRALLSFFVLGLVVSGLTAIPLRWEAGILQALAGPGAWLGQAWPEMGRWVAFVHESLEAVAQRYPLLFYGTDWLAFGHVVIAVAFWGALRDPARNRWVIDWGMIACVLVIPWAMIFGPLRGIPWFWRLADCSFGVFGIVPLWLARRDVLRLEALARAEVVLPPLPQQPLGRRLA